MSAFGGGQTRLAGFFWELDGMGAREHEVPSFSLRMHE